MLRIRMRPKKTQGRKRRGRTSLEIKRYSEISYILLLHVTHRPTAMESFVQKIDIRNRASKLKRITEARRKTLEKEIQKLDGEYVLITRCFSEDKKRGCLQNAIQVISSNRELERNSMKFLPLFEEEEDEEESKQKILGADAHVDVDATHWLILPRRSCEVRCKLRKLLTAFWKAEHPHSKKKGQIYAACKSNPGLVFDWWKEHFSSWPFDNRTLRCPAKCREIYTIAAPLLYRKLTGKENAIIVEGTEDHIDQYCLKAATTIRNTMTKMTCTGREESSSSDSSSDDNEDTNMSTELLADVPRCKRSASCSRMNGHRGRCSPRIATTATPTETPSVLGQLCQKSKHSTREDRHPGKCNRKGKIEDTATPNTAEMLAKAREILHKDDPILCSGISPRQFIAVRDLLSGGTPRLEAFRQAGFRVSREYIQSEDGHERWNAFVSMFPDWINIIVEHCHANSERIRKKLGIGAEMHQPRRQDQRKK